MKKHSRSSGFGKLVLLTAAAALAAYAGSPGRLAFPRVRTASAMQESYSRQEMEELHQLADNLGRLFRYTAETVSPTVVWIEAERKVTLRSPSPGFSDPFFRRFFGPEFEEFFGPRTREREFRQQGLGSGVIIDKDGHILTNHHVVAEADKLTVKLVDGREFNAEIAGSDEATELAVIRLKDVDGDLPVAALGDSDELYVGEWVIAIGNPMGLSYTVSSGIVSAKGRSVGLARYENLIQTDAAINPGNSGGPLVNLKGEVIGINTAIISQTGGYMGIGLAIPINMAKPILGAMIAGETVERGFLGIYGADLTPELAEAFGYEGRKGALVNDVIAGSPADKAGIEAGDIVMKWDGKDIEDFTRLRLMVAETAPGSTVDVVVFRDGGEIIKELQVGSLTAQEGEARAETWLRVEVVPVTDELRRRYGIPDLEGVVVREVKPESPAENILRPGDVIIEVDRTQVRNVEGFRKLVAGTDPEAGCLLRVLDSRTGRTHFMRIRGR